MTTIDTLSPIAPSEFEQAVERKALEQVYEEVLDPSVDEAQLRAVAHEVADFPGFAFAVEIPQLYEKFYAARSLDSRDETGRGRTDFATREYNEQAQAPGEALDGWFSVFEDGSMRYAFAHTNFSKDDYPGTRSSRLRPYAITVAPDQAVEVTTMAYRQGASREVVLQDTAQRQECIEQAFYDTFLAARRMSQRSSEERHAANRDARDKLIRTKRTLEDNQRLFDEYQNEPASERPLAHPQMTEGSSWIIPSDFDY